jgi:hypothetical protein
MPAGDNIAALSISPSPLLWTNPMQVLLLKTGTSYGANQADLQPDGIAFFQQQDLWPYRLPKTTVIL